VAAQISGPMPSPSRTKSSVTLGTSRAADSVGSLSHWERGGVRGLGLSKKPNPLTPTLSPAGRGSRRDSRHDLRLTSSSQSLPNLCGALAGGRHQEADVSLGGDEAHALLDESVLPRKVALAAEPG